MQREVDLFKSICRPTLALLIRVVDLREGSQILAHPEPLLRAPTKASQEAVMAFLLCRHIQLVYAENGVADMYRKPNGLYLMKSDNVSAGSAVAVFAGLHGQYPQSGSGASGGGCGAGDSGGAGSAQGPRNQQQPILTPCKFARMQAPMSAKLYAAITMPQNARISHALQLSHDPQLLILSPKANTPL